MKTYLTEYTVTTKKRYGSEVYGDNWEDAQANANALGLGEVIGTLIQEESHD